MICNLLTSASPCCGFFLSFPLPRQSRWICRWSNLLRSCEARTKASGLPGRKWSWRRMNTRSSMLFGIHYQCCGSLCAYVEPDRGTPIPEPVTDPAKEYVHSILPNDQFISSLLDKIGQNTLTLPLISQNITSIDANLTWPILLAASASMLARSARNLSPLPKSTRTGKREPTGFADSKYFGLRLGQRVVEVKTETYNSLKIHYDQALKLEQQG